MCGVIGYSGNQNAAPIIFEGLKCLEYRGYDSAGIATLSDHTLHHKKDIGYLFQVEARQHLSLLPGNTGIGHVRWATNGDVSQVNAHPQIDCTGNIAVVHNGIIENVGQIKHRLLSRHTFVSDTDTEVLPHLIADHVKAGESLVEAVRSVNREITGAWAFLAISASEPETIVATSNELPLLVATSPRGTTIASDIISFPQDCREFACLDNGETALIRSGHLAFFDVQGNPIIKKMTDIKSRAPIDRLPANSHHMLKEIIEQPLAIKRALEQNADLIQLAAHEIRKSRQVIFTACGSSRYAALLGRYLFSRVGKKFSDVVIGSEFRYFSGSMDYDTLVIAVSQSGETADVLDGVKASKEAGAKIVSIVNRQNSRLTSLSDIIFLLNCGQETAVAATKSFTSELVLFYLLSHALVNQNKDISNKISDLANLLQLNLDRSAEQARDLAHKLKGMNSCFLIARGSNLHIATEAALKLKEVAYIYAEGMPAGELKHGSLALVEKGTAVFVVCPHDYTFRDTMANAQEAKSRGAHIIGISDRQDPMFDDWLKIPAVEEVLFPLVTVVPLQLLAYYSALERGINPDRPRNLAKSVTVR